MGRRGSPRRPTPVVRSAPHVVRSAPPPPPVPPQPQGPGLLKQMAATAAGVAVGSAIGHSVGNALSGGSSQPEAVAAQQDPAASPINSLMNSPCRYPFDELLQCVRENNEVSRCQYAANVLRDCMSRYDIP